MHGFLTEKLAFNYDGCMEGRLFVKPRLLSSRQDWNVDDIPFRTTMEEVLLLIGARRLGLILNSMSTASTEFNFIGDRVVMTTLQGRMPEEAETMEVGFNDLTSLVDNRVTDGFLVSFMENPSDRVESTAFAVALLAFACRAFPGASIPPIHMGKGPSRPQMAVMALAMMRMNLPGQILVLDDVRLQASTGLLSITDPRMPPDDVTVVTLQDLYDLVVGRIFPEWLMLHMRSDFSMSDRVVMGLGLLSTAL